MNALFRFPPEAVTSVAATDKTAILSLLAEHFAEVYTLDAVEVLDALEEREKLGSTGFGRGVAIPHARLDTINRPLAVLLRLDQACEFGSADGMPVDLVFGLLSPSQSGATHLHALAAISRLVRNEDTHRQLAEAPDGEALYALITNAVDRDAA
ncbi:PTS sugar transporter subunit IIA [Parerythrobacter jejuensis]|uniref:PTS transporter subunit EIIA n=1 Tax=Parerythrobacter jejuensis TaxID=795812 RepID=A0A845APY3_9SPHN|nr:PTS sugar transporter subunit IIA [Parerythrobacter jejuensis]MXP30955.1 PTS transporter subunit EIIA [Parerythrobacter jejuensis]MXP33715.1 PTS transporter subunit EIIA [Parerythrobacter jejuensis]